MTLKRFITFLILALSLCNLYGQQKQRMALFVDQLPAAEGAENREEVREDIRKAAEDALTYYLNISNEFNVITFSTIPDGLSRDTLGAAAEKFGFDQIIYTKLPSSGSDSAPAAVYLFDREKGETTYSSEGEVDLSGVGSRSRKAHELFKPMFDQLLDVRNSWSSVEFDPRGGDGDYSVVVDGVLAGQNIKPLFMPKRDLVVEVLQSRPFGTQILLEQRITADDNAKAGISFAIPGLTDLEQSAFAEIDKAIRDGDTWNSDRAAVKDQFESLTKLYQGFDASSELQQMRDKYKTWEKDFEADRPPTEIAIEVEEEKTSEEIAAEIEINVTAAIEPIPSIGLGPVLLGATGPLLDRLGGLARIMAHESMFSEDQGLFIPTYGNMTYSVATANKYMYWSALGLWGASGLTETLLFPYKTYTLSSTGKILYSGGELLDLAGNMLAHISQSVKADLSIVSYSYDSADSADINYIQKELNELETRYAVTRIGSFAAWTLGTAASISAPLFSGDQTLAVAGPWKKGLHAAGSILTVLGDLASIISYNAGLAEMRLADEYRDLVSFDSDPDAYTSYDTIYKIYAISTLGTYGFWGLGALSSALAVILPESPGGAIQPVNEQQPRPEPLFTIARRGDRIFAGFRMSM
ncbi:MAG: hypothetical protein HN368_16130 [Spirochaetales bacterium]|jgi:hypothetical protein|nr:hypothetical protein [Spirochaetales bacterium]